jgi:hypothetical protein
MTGRKAKYLIGAAIIVVAVGGLIYSGVKESVVYFYTPTASTAGGPPSAVHTIPSASQPRLRVPPSAAVLRSRRRGVHSGREGGDEHAPSGGSDGDRR